MANLMRTKTPLQYKKMAICQNLNSLSTQLVWMKNRLSIWDSTIHLKSLIKTSHFILTSRMIHPNFWMEKLHKIPMDLGSWRPKCHRQSSQDRRTFILSTLWASSRTVCKVLHNKLLSPFSTTQQRQTPATVTTCPQHIQLESNQDFH